MENSVPPSLPAGASLVAVCGDLFFGVKIQDAAKRAGLQARFVKTREAALDAARQSPALLVVDLDDRQFDTVALIAALKADAALRGMPVIGFLSHVHEDLRRRAELAGCDLILPRSQFAEGVVELLGRLRKE